MRHLDAQHPDPSSEVLPRATPPTPWLPFSNSNPPRSTPEVPDPAGRVLVFTHLGLDTFTEQRGPRLELSPDDFSADDEHLRALIAEFAASRLDVPVSPSGLRVQFDPNISHGRVRLADPAWPSASALARFRVYKQGSCPRVKAKSREQVKFWGLVGVSPALSVSAGFLAGGAVGAALLGIGWVAFVCFRYGL